MQRCLFALLCLVACEGGVSGTNPDARTTNDSSGPDAAPPTPSGCVTDVSAGNHDYTCEGLAVNAQIPPACLAPGCGLILQLHGDTGNGALMDAHSKPAQLPLTL